MFLRTLIFFFFFFLNRTCRGAATFLTAEERGKNHSRNRLAIAGIQTKKGRALEVFDWENERGGYVTKIYFATR